MWECFPQPKQKLLTDIFLGASWIIRLYKVKDLDNVGRDHGSAAAFEKGHKKKGRKGSKRGVRVLREE
jgi:dolichyl-diphosphooligosaccharide---protein glycosyltransferase